MPPPRLPHKPGESAETYVKRLTAAEGAPIPEAHVPLVIYQEHRLWVFIGNLIKRWQVFIGLAGICSVAAYTGIKVDRLIVAVDAASTRLAKVDTMVTKEELDKAVAKITADVTARVVDSVHEKVVQRITNSKDIIVSCPAITVRGLSNKACQIERLKSREQ